MFQNQIYGGDLLAVSLNLRVVASLVDRLVVLDNSGYPGYTFVLSREGGRTRKTAVIPDHLVELVNTL
jgi:hypothetical protein